MEATENILLKNYNRLSLGAAKNQAANMILLWLQSSAGCCPCNKKPPLNWSLSDKIRLLNVIRVTPGDRKEPIIHPH